MARQRPVIALLAASACREYEPYTGIFDLPVAAAVLQPELGGPFDEPIGFVANGHGGAIVPLALKQGRVLTDDDTVSFLRANLLATGGDRVLTSVAVTAPSLEEVTVWAGDRRFTPGLLRLPYVTAGPDGVPRETAASFEVTGSTGGARLTDVGVKTGYTTTEDWTITADGGEWIVEGTRSGRQPERAVAGEPYSALERRLEFTIQGQGADGDTFSVHTDNGLEEIDVLGAPVALAASPDQALLAMIVEDEGGPVVRWLDTASRALTDVTLAPDATPHRLAWTDDGALLVADRTRPAVWEVAAGDAVAIEHEMPWPTLDAAALAGEDRRRLYVVPLDGSALWLYDRDTGEAIDVDAAREGDQGMGFHIPVSGIEALHLPYLMPEYTEDGIRIRARAVAVSLSDSTVVFAHEETGCLVQDNLGPRTASSFGPPWGDYDDSSFASTVPGPATLELNDANSRHVIVNACAGLATAEDWELRYDQNAQGWRVSGTFSGDQDGLAVEDERYVSDGGEVSFVVRAGTSPSRDGWTIRFSVDPGVATATGDNDGDGVREVSVGVGSDPVAFAYRVGLPGPVGDIDGKGWYPVDIRPLALVLGSSSDEIARVDPQRASLEVGWE